MSLATALAFLNLGFASANSLAQSPGPTAIYRVFVRNAQDVSRLTSGGWDVLEARGKDYLLVAGDAAVAEALRSQGFRLEVERTTPGAEVAPFTFYGGYRTVFEHYQHLDAVATAHPNLAKVIDYGDSWRKLNAQPGGHDLKAICLTRLQPGDCALDPDTGKPRFFLMAAIHARELTTSEMAWRWIDYLVNNYGVDADVTWLMNHHEMWVVPVTNPDGRFIVETSNLWQRKNANLTHCPSGAFGVDLNRNASFAWGGTGSSGEPCEDTYRGPSPASEPEEYQLEALMRQLFRDQRGTLLTDAAPMTTTGSMITLHSYSNLVLLPWGWVDCTYGSPCPSDLRAPNDAGLRSLAFRMSYFNGFDTGQASELLYAADGATDDWAYGALGIAAYTFEIGPQFGTCDAFHPDYACQDSLFWPANRGALLYAAKTARQPYALSLGPSATGLTLGISGTLMKISATLNDDVYGATGIDRPAVQPISAAQFYVDVPPWAGGTPVAMTAQDGAFNATAEQAVGVFDSRAVGLGRHTLFVRGRDAAGNWGPVTAIWFTTQLLPIVTR